MFHTTHEKTFEKVYLVFFTKKFYQENSGKMVNLKANI